MNTILPKDNKGQALLLVVIVLFIVFFLVVSLSENISVDTLSTQNNVDFQKALDAAQSGINAAEKLALGSLPATFTTSQFGSCSNFFNVPGYQCSYVIIPSTSINQVLQKDTTAQARVSGPAPLSAEVSFSDASSAVILNIVNSDNSGYMCIIYPDAMAGKYSQFHQVSGCPTPDVGNASGGYFKTTINLPSNAQYLRATLVNYSGNGSSIIISPSANTVQQYEIIGTGYYNGSRRIIDTHLNIYGNPPSIFDYVLFNGGPKSPINF